MFRLAAARCFSVAIGSSSRMQTSLARAMMMGKLRLDASTRLAFNYPPSFAGVDDTIIGGLHLFEGGLHGGLCLPASVFHFHTLPSYYSLLTR